MNITGLPLDKATELLGDTPYEIIDVSHPDKYHLDVKSSKRVIKATESGGKVILFVADFVDSVNN